MSVNYGAYKDIIAFYRYALFITVYKYIPDNEEQVVSFLHFFQFVDMIIITGFLLVLIINSVFLSIDSCGVCCEDFSVMHLE